ncbi:hypothetical protein PAB09_11200 [Corynebacterium sp. SCR221107]|uniref:hypothetical protein n=1 Tax=Corynebacterium sp. SCR221107 TaxID=3017361 RepID=UPI0022EC50C3|nr:hypothetical protein [Corynebacterium sp. SCR221107]WBT08422.1 hypothetical protein PAB09_11200 [Corynebacterium sp. SCR221107]
MKTTAALTGQIAWRLWLVVAVTGAIAAGFYAAGLAMAVAAPLITIAGLAAPLALLCTICWALRIRAGLLPKLLRYIGGGAIIVAVIGLIIARGEPALIVTAALGVWFMLVGLVFGMFAR